MNDPGVLDIQYSTFLDKYYSNPDAPEIIYRGRKLRLHGVLEYIQGPILLSRYCYCNIHPADKIYWEHRILVKIPKGNKDWMKLRIGSPVAVTCTFKKMNWSVNFNCNKLSANVDKLEAPNENVCIEIKENQ